jgi:polysaccharide deacetylase family protein (PEP-CTERM system associated)
LRREITNALSMDVEGFVESNLQSFPISPSAIDRRNERREVEANVAAVLELLDGLRIRATFFFLGTVADRLPELVRDVAELGHEVASHSYEHLRLPGLRPMEFAERLRASKERLEDLSGSAVYGFRAPDFSITRSSLWALDVLGDLGFVYDSSIYPIGMHDVYGIPGAEPNIHTLPGGLIEFPLSTVELFGRRIPFGGGGYFRLYPVSVTRLLISGLNRRGQPCMFFIHPYEAGPVIPRLDGLGPYRRFRHYVNIRHGPRRLRRVVDGFRFAPAIDVLRERRLVEV